MKWFKTISAALGLLLMVGCIPIRTSGTTHYLVLGIGVVSVNNTNQYAASVTKANVLGGYVSEHGGGVGYSSEQRIMVSTNVNMDIEVSKVPFKPMKVNVK
jgi:hypothetical protein